MKIKIENDVYAIAKRIKEIDKDYYIVYDTSRQIFEIHNSAQIGGSYCLTLPFNTLDERTLNYVLETSSRNIEKILENIENENKLLENKEKREVLNQAKETLTEKIKE